MSELLLTTCDSGGGHLLAAGIGDRVMTFVRRLAEGPIPASGPPERFFTDRRALYEAEGLPFEDWWFDVEPKGVPSRKIRVWSGLPDLARQFDQVTFWIDPDPNAQLTLIQLLDWIGHIPEILPKLRLKQSEERLGARNPGNWFMPPVPITIKDVGLASRAWAAFRTSTPQAWAALLNEDLGRLPGLRNAVLGMLDELPDASGLGAGARRILRLTERYEWWDKIEARGEAVDYPFKDKDRPATALLQRVGQVSTRMAPGFWEFGQTMCALGTAHMPALAGITETSFDLAMHDDETRRRTFMESPVTLTEFGRRVRDGAANWSQHNPVHRWWGGTRLTGSSLWRWNGATQRLLEP
ncbi:MULTISPECIES: hypothetical protein [Asaia]|uniref:DUF1835 domain-containing protein n=2 Tax=Asaia TaxID=91914 RepID=A0A060QHP1_9PROT|nr:hypothetical protein [Asaia bogorensis]CDG40480.1 hypothetical protein ASAP_2435 [Asaia bogorensis]